MPSKHASNDFVWKNWKNETGWSSGVAFLAGVLNGAFTIGTTDGVCHLAEGINNSAVLWSYNSKSLTCFLELPNPRRDLPRAILAQIGLGSIFAFCFAVSLFYGLTDIGPVLNSNGSFPLAAAYLEATGSTAATFGLLFIIFLSLTPCLIGTYLTVPIL